MRTVENAPLFYAIIVSKARRGICKENIHVHVLECGNIEIHSSVIEPLFEESDGSVRIILNVDLSA